MRRLWFRCKDAAGRRWRVVLTDKKLSSGAHKDCYGVTDFERRCISISLRHSSMKELQETTMHELVHASCGVGLRDDMEEVAEETIARKAEAGLRALLLSSGFVFPEWPDGVEMPR